MKKLSALILLFAVLFSYNSSTLAQYSISLKGGYNLPLPDLKGDYPGDSLSYLQKNGFGFGANGKWYFGKTRNLGVTLDLGYNMFSSGDINATGLDTAYFTTMSGNINIFRAALGVEYSIMPNKKVNPFLGLEFTGNFFSGEWKNTKNSIENTYTLKSASRFGLGIGAGVDIAVSKNIGVVIGGKYNLANLIGKDTATTTTSNEFTLMDGEYSYGNTTISARNISYIEFYAGVVFHLGKILKRK